MTRVPACGVQVEVDHLTALYDERTESWRVRSNGHFQLGHCMIMQGSNRKEIVFSTYDHLTLRDILALGELMKAIGAIRESPATHDSL
jgi:hypothetical protein